MGPHLSKLTYDLYGSNLSRMVGVKQGGGPLIHLSLHWLSQRGGLRLSVAMIISDDSLNLSLYHRKMNSVLRTLCAVNNLFYFVYFCLPLHPPAIMWFIINCTPRPLPLDFLASLCTYFGTPLVLFSVSIL